MVSPIAATLALLCATLAANAVPTPNHPVNGTCLNATQPHTGNSGFADKHPKGSKLGNFNLGGVNATGGFNHTHPVNGTHHKGPHHNGTHHNVTHHGHPHHNSTASQLPRSSSAIATSPPTFTAKPHSSASAVSHKLTSSVAVPTTSAESVPTTSAKSAAPIVSTKTSAAVSKTSAVAVSTTQGAVLASSSSPSSASTTAQQAAYLDPQNAERAAHGASALTWSTTLEASAQAWANKCVFEHSGGNYGENLAAGTGSFSPLNAVDAWDAEETSYDPANPQYSHWTQVVWKSTTQVGCAVASCEGIFDASYGPAQFYVCQYNPPGNVIGEFAANVQK